MRDGVIFLVPVPIGNLRDITLRALDIFGTVALIACEDTRKTAFLLSQHSIKAPALISFHKFNERQREEKLFAHLESGQNLAIASDAGSPAISDPALGFIKKAIRKGIKIVALPGATALIPAVSISGLGEGSFQFLGFLPVKNKERQKIFEELKTYPLPSVIYESVHHLKDTLTQLYQALGNRQISIAREISKLHEECIRSTLADVLDDFEITLKGEFVIVLDGARVEKAAFPSPEVEEFVRANPGQKTKALAVLLAERFGVSKNQAYSYLNEFKNQEKGS